MAAMNETTPPTRNSLSTVLAGVLGGLIVLVVGAVLIATDVIDTGTTTTRVVREGVASAPISDSSDDSGDERTVSDPDLGDDDYSTRR